MSGIRQDMAIWARSPSPHGSIGILPRKKAAVWERNPQQQPLTIFTTFSKNDSCWDILYNRFEFLPKFFLVRLQSISTDIAGKGYSQLLVWHHSAWKDYTKIKLENLLDVSLLGKALHGFPSSLRDLVCLALCCMPFKTSVLCSEERVPCAGENEIPCLPPKGVSRKFPRRGGKR